MRRFPNPKQLMAYLGLIPSEHSSGKTKQTVVTAIARELSAFIWAIDKEMQFAEE